MTTKEAREFFDKVIEHCRGNGEKDRVALLELCREYFCNADFRESLRAHLWKKEQGEV